MNHPTLPNTKSNVIPFPSIPLSVIGLRRRIAGAWDVIRGRAAALSPSECGELVTQSMAKGAARALPSAAPSPNSSGDPAYFGVMVHLLPDDGGTQLTSAFFRTRDKDPDTITRKFAASMVDKQPLLKAYKLIHTQLIPIPDKFIPRPSEPRSLEEIFDRLRAILPSQITTEDGLKFAFAECTSLLGILMDLAGPDRLLSLLKSEAPPTGEQHPWTPEVWASYQAAFKTYLLLEHDLIVRARAAHDYSVS